MHLDLTATNAEAQARLREKLRTLCDSLDIHPHLFDRTLYLGKDTPIGGTAHQAGTLRFGPDPDSSVLDLDCRAHGIDNLYVTDASFFPSIGAVKPTLTIIANALRVPTGSRRGFSASSRISDPGRCARLLCRIGFCRKPVPTVRAGCLRPVQPWRRTL